MKVIVGVVAVLAAIALVPLLAIITFVGVTVNRLLACQSASGPQLISAPVPAQDGSPSILGGSSLSAGQIAAWWTGSRRPDTSTLIGTDIATLASMYVGNQDGVRGDLAFAQAVVETGGFTSPDATDLNNFAGIAHTDTAAHGSGFPSVQAGVTAQTQLLAEVVLGNKITFPEPKVAPNWGGATETTWAGLAGVWASATDYWTVVGGVYQSMLTGEKVSGPGTGSGPGPVQTATPCSSDASGAVAVAIDFAEAQVGKPYQWGGTGNPSYDCSGLIQAAYKAAGVSIPRTTYGQVVAGTAVPDVAALIPGDVILPNPDHEFMVVSLNPVMVVEAAHTGTTIRVRPLEPGEFWQARRMVVPTPSLTSAPSPTSATADMTSPNTVFPDGVPISYSFYPGPEIDQRTPGGMSAATAWGVVWTEQGDSPATNTRVEVSNLVLDLWSNSKGAWVEYQSSNAPAGGAYLSPTAAPFDNGSITADLRVEPDGGVSDKMIAGTWFHFWPAAGRAAIPASDIGGAYSSFQARLVVDNPALQNDTASARYVAAAGADWWATTTAPWPQNNQAFYGRFSQITTQWQTFSGATR